MVPIAESGGHIAKSGSFGEESFQIRKGGGHVQFVHFEQVRWIFLSQICRTNWNINHGKNGSFPYQNYTDPNSKSTNNRVQAKLNSFKITLTIFL